MALLLIVGIALLGFATSALVRAIRLPRIHAAENLGQISSYGFGGDVAADPAPIDNQREIAALFGRSIAGRLGDKQLTAMRRELLAAGMYSITPEGLIGLTVLSLLTLPALFAYAFASIGQPAAVIVLMTLIGAGMGLVLPRTLVRRRARVRLESIDYAMPELVDLLVVTMEAGVGFVASLRLAGERLGGPLADELRLLVQEQTLGASTSAALANWVDRCGPASVRSFVRAIGQGDRLGVSMGHIMRDLAHEMRARRRQIAEERANRAPVKLLFPLVFLIFPAMFIVLLAPSIKPILDVFGGN